jgi:glyoxylate reductase
MVSNTPGAVDDATATTALYLLLATMRQYTHSEISLRQHAWKPAGIAPKAHDITGKTIAILGLGGIGLRLAHLVHAFPMRVIYHNRQPKPDAPTWCEYFSDVEEMLGQADVLSVHVPLKEETVGLVGEKWIRKLRKGSIIINTARGKVIDEEAMIKALEDGHVSGYRPVSFHLKCSLVLFFSVCSSARSVWTSSRTNQRSILTSSSSITSPCSRIWVRRTAIRSARWKSEH